ncbi:UMP kinase [Candidatus Falkowbacteria bacterium]|nr:UMP kinase [Candidatus Falkowbacteria bacterium]
MNKDTYIISLGGSLVVPKTGVDWKFLKRFRDLIIREIKRGKKFFIIVGGGKTARDYVAAAAKVVKVANDDKDWLGIHSTRLNAHLLRAILRDVAHPEIIKNPTFRLAVKEKVVVAGGWKPGWSTDYVATIIAQEYGIKTIINLSNIDYVYDKDPKKNKTAKKFKRMDWRSFRKIVGDKWDPGLSAPFDPVASQKCEHLGLEVIIMNGDNLKNVKNYLKNKKFKGTTIRN